MISKNKRNISEHRYERKLQKIEMNCKKLKERTLSVQMAKEELFKATMAKKLHDINSSNWKRIIRKEEAHSYRIIRNWILSNTTWSIIYQLYEKYSLRKKIRNKTNKYLRRVFFIMKAIGKLLIKLNNFRVYKSTRTLQILLLRCRDKWCSKIRHNLKARAANFLDKYSQSTNLSLLIMHVANRILIIQHWFRRYLTKKRLMLAIMNIQWAAIEYLMIEDKLVNRINLKKIIRITMRKRYDSEIVPIKVRLYYIQQELDVNFVYYSE